MIPAPALVRLDVMKEDVLQRAPVLRELLPFIQRKADRSFLTEAQERMRKWQEMLEERGTCTDVPMKPQRDVYFDKVNGATYVLSRMPKRAYLRILNRYDASVAETALRDAVKDSIRR